MPRDPGRNGLRLRGMLLFSALAAGVLLALGLGLLAGYRRLDAPELSAAVFQGGLIAGFASLGLIAGAWLFFDTHIARAADTLAAALRARAHADVANPLDPTAARHLGDLGLAAQAATDALAETRNALAAAVERETTRLREEKARLEAVLSDVPVGVLLCSATHQIVFYNGQAVDLLGAGQAPGLDRNLFEYLREGPVRHAHQRLTEAGETDAAADLVCSTGDGAQILAGRMRLVDMQENGAPRGYVLILRDVTADLAGHARREQLLAEIFDRVRRPAANLQTVVGVLSEGDPPPEADRLRAALLQEVETLVRAITELGARYDAQRTDWWPLAQTRSADLLDSIRARLEAAGLRVAIEDPQLILRCDAFELVALLSGLAERLVDAGRADALTLRLIEEDGPGAAFELRWQGAPLPVGELDTWLDAPLEEGLADVTGRSVLFNHGTEAWPEQHRDGSAVIRLPIREARRAGRRPPPITRSLVYDFDLLSKERSDRVADTSLNALTYVVFDTETTGLSPERDEIVQLAALRLVNGRIVKEEWLDTLVDPGRAIPPASTEVHGITDQMVQGAPDIAAAGARFRRFAEGAVLVAHNAPFDIAFLRRYEGVIGGGFDHPVLDTVLLSAVLFGQQETHSLDALSARLGIVIPEVARHTAMGDTVATAEAFLKMLPMLRARGLITFSDVLAEIRRHGRLLKDINA